MARPERARLKTSTELPTKASSRASSKASSTSQAGGLDLIFIVVCVIGIGISSYLAWTHFTDTPIICTENQSCDTVNRSAYAYFPPNWGIPVSVLGLAGYLLMAGLGLARWRIAGLPDAYRRLSRLDMGLFVATLGGVIFSGYLTAMELWVIHAICWWCVASAITITLLFIMAMIRVWNAE